MKRYLLFALGVAITTLISINDANTAEVKPKFTIIFERTKEISCSQDQKNIVIDFTNYYTTIYRTNTYNKDLACKISLSYDKPKFTKTKSGYLDLHVQVFENDSWIRAFKSEKNVGEYGCGFPSGLTTQESKKPGNDNRYRLDLGIPLGLLYVSPPISDEFKAEGKSYFYGLKSGAYCVEQTPGPLKIRFEIINGKFTYYSNEISLSYINYDKIVWDGRKCNSTSQIITPEDIGSTKSSPSATANPRTGPTALKSCTTNEKLALTQIDRQKYPLLQRQYGLQLELQKLQYDYGVAYLTGGQDRIQIEISRVESDLSSIGRSIDSLSSQRKKILVKCDPNAQPSSTGVPNLKQCSQTEISRMQSLEKQYRALMRQADVHTSEIDLLQNRIGYLMLQGKMQEIAAANFAIEDQTQYRDQAYAQASYAEKQFETANSACLNSGISLKK